MRTPSLFDTVPRFDGVTVDPAVDQERLTQQLGRVFSVVRDGLWRTLDEIGAAALAPQASVSARLRGLRKPRFGAYLVERRRCGVGLFEYRIAGGDSRHDE